MDHDRKPGFHTGKLEDGTYVAASVSTPFFCFVGDTEDEVVAKAERAIRFFFSGEGRVFEAPLSQSKQVIRFVPQRHVEVALEEA